MEYAFLFYHRCDDNMFETCVKTLRLVSGCKIVVGTDNVPEEMRTEWTNSYGIEWIIIPRQQMKGRRAAAKLEVLKDFTDTLLEGDKVFICDVDMYFLLNPFEAFVNRTFDVGFTTRGYNYSYAINGGAYLLNINEASCNWVHWHVEQIHNPTWNVYRALNKNHRKRFGLDWAVGQDFMLACWEHRDAIKKDKDICIEDVGSHYNYCPPSDQWAEKAFIALRKAYRDKTHAVLHLKGALKDILYEGLFEHAITKYPKCQHDWFGAGKNT